MYEGFIILHREFLNWGWYQDVNTTKLFIHLLLKANHADSVWEGIVIKRGQHLTSLNKLATDNSLTIQNVRTSLKRLKSTNDITINSTKQYTLITIVNYDILQGVNSTANTQTNLQPNPQLTHDQHRANTQLTTNNNDNNKNNDNNDKKSIGAKPQRSHFVKPTIEEIQNYCQERNNSVSPQRFYDYYEARGWCLSKGQKVKDWKACVRTWENSGYNNKSQEETTQNTSVVDEQEWLKNYEAMRQAEEKAREKALAEKLGIKL